MRGPEPPEAAPVFVVGCPRSGTTLLQHLLEAHPALCIAPETFFVRRFWKRRRRYGNLRREGNLGRLVEDIVATPEFADMRLDAAAYRREAAAGPRTYAALFGLLLEQFRRRTGAAVAGEKTPNHVLYMPALAGFFPAARFIHVVRDPRAVVNSWRTVPWSTGGVAGDAEVWRRYVSAARRRPPPDPSALFTLRYEALVAAPEQRLGAVCRFLGLPFDPRMLAHERRPSRSIDLRREPWKAGAERPLTTAPAARWREELSPQAIARIEAVTGREMRRLGYEPRTSPGRLRAASSVRACRRAASLPLRLSRAALRRLRRGGGGQRLKDRRQV